MRGLSQTSTAADPGSGPGRGQGLRDARAQAYFEQLDGPMAEVATFLRADLLARAPDLDEVLKWGLPIYGRPQNLLSIVAHERWVNLQFFNGAHLTTHRQHLLGDGRNLRHLRLLDLAAAQQALVQELLQESLELGLSAQVR